MENITLVKQYVDYAGDEHESEVKCRVTKNYFIIPNGQRLSIKKMVDSKYGVKPNGEVYNIRYYFKNENDKDYFLKLEQIAKRDIEMSLDFMDTITFGEMQEQAKKNGLYIKFGKNGLSFHKRIGEKHHQRAAEYRISIKPIKDYSRTIGHCINDSIYDLVDYNKKLASVKPVTTEISEEIKNDLYEKYHVVVFNMKNYFSIGMSYKGDRNTMYNNWCHCRGTAKLKYNDFNEKKLYELAEKICNQNKNLF